MRNWPRSAAGCSARDQETRKRSRGVIRTRAVDGLAVGADVGTNVGAADGMSVGSDVGDVEGSLLGESEGFADGDADGLPEGEADGARDGAADGVVVASRVHAEARLCTLGTNGLPYGFSPEGSKGIPSPLAT